MRQFQMAVKSKVFVRFTYHFQGLRSEGVVRLEKIKYIFLKIYTRIVMHFLFVAIFRLFMVKFRLICLEFR